MSTFDHDDARQVLRAIAGHDPVVIGTFALLMRGRLPAGFAPADVDVVCARAAVLPLATELRALGFVTTSWSDTIDARFDPALLDGRFYVRATRGSLVVDATYEGPLAYADARSRAERIDAVLVACVDDVLSLKRGRASERDRAILAALGE